VQIVFILVEDFASEVLRVYPSGIS